MHFHALLESHQFDSFPLKHTIIFISVSDSIS
uniref:Uncharacterized protein n=1 Tax=Rhizophora mucronata TaxID=61149 RepID=A0A2P2Q9Z2_RHIMU